ncbi:MAG: 3-dehydroquinate synthase [Planctomycetaceae bacterium]|nr:3-dehydroquinate synthase [Planctomycetaceae bacterium]
MSSTIPFTTIQVYLGLRTYEIAIGDALLSEAARYLASWNEKLNSAEKTTGKALIVTDQNVQSLHAETVLKSLIDSGWHAEVITLEPGESSKNINVVTGMYDNLVEMQADRQTLVVAVGGGVIGDSAGFLAATYARGIPFIQVPTSLLAMVDSSVGGKVGVNLPQAKNLVGSFYQPLGVLIDTDTLNTLPAREYISGLAEVIKYGVILDESFFKYLEENVEGLNNREPAVMKQVIARSCRLKADIVEQDEFERTGLRAVLNYGHTFAHAFEALAGYGELLHGEAVSIGMVYASRLAEKLGRITGQESARQVNLLKAVGLPIELPAGCEFSADDILQKMLLDKKTVGGQLRFVLPTEIGNVEMVKGVAEETVREVL